MQLKQKGGGGGTFIGFKNLRLVGILIIGIAIIVSILMGQRNDFLNVYIMDYSSSSTQSSLQQQQQQTLLSTTTTTTTTGGGSLASNIIINNNNTTTATKLKFLPVHCKDTIFKHFFANQQDDPNGGHDNIVTRTNATRNPFYISLHNRIFDGARYDIFLYGRYYERALEDVWEKILLQSPPNSHILDVGGNVGYYSLFSASLGKFYVTAFEPFPPNLLRFCESIGINHWNQPNELPFIQVYDMGISNQNSVLHFLPSASNPGAGHFLSELEYARLHRKKNDPNDKHHKSSMEDVARIKNISVITLDEFAIDQGWLEKETMMTTMTLQQPVQQVVQPVNIAILKIDVERHESQVVQGAIKLLKSGLVQNIFTEVGKSHHSAQMKMLQTFVDCGYYLVGQGGFRGPSEQVVSWPQDTMDERQRLPKEIMDFLISKPKAKYLNLWWSLDRHANDNN